MYNIFTKPSKKHNPVLNTNISLDSLRHSDTFAKTYCKLMIEVYKLMGGNLDTIFYLNSIQRNP